MTQKSSLTSVRSPSPFGKFPNGDTEIATKNKLEEAGIKSE